MHWSAIVNGGKANGVKPLLTNCARLNRIGGRGVGE